LLLSGEKALDQLVNAVSLIVCDSKALQDDIASKAKRLQHHVLNDIKGRVIHNDPAHCPAFLLSHPSDPDLSSPQCDHDHPVCPECALFTEIFDVLEHHVLPDVKHKKAKLLPKYRKAHEGSTFFAVVSFLDLLLFFFQNQVMLPLLPPHLPLPPLHILLELMTVLPPLCRKMSLPADLGFWTSRNVYGVSWGI
jgi:hypothetical protein